jgi:uncharacterized protein HemX
VNKFYPLIGIIAIILAVGGLYFYQKNKETPTQQVIQPQTQGVQQQAAPVQQSQPQDPYANFNAPARQ